jgi:excisionase family DNA binding protein
MPDERFKSVERPIGLQEAAAFLSTSPTTLRLWVSQGRIAHSRLGRRLLFLPADLQRLLAGGRVEARDGGQSGGSAARNAEAD